MTKDDIIRMAREAGATPYTNRHYPDRPTHTFNPEQLERFAALVAAAEREACAKVCHDASVPLPGELQSDAQWSALCLATTIRAKGQA